MIFGTIADILGRVVEKIIPDPEKRREFELELERLHDQAAEREHQERLAQVDVNKTEARHRSVFIAGWRPAVGWVGAAGLAFQAIIFPLLQGVGLDMPEIDTELLILTLTSILGVGAMRSYDKRNGTSNDYLRAPVETSPPEDAPWAQ